MKETGTVTLGGVEHPIKAFTLDELQIILPAIISYGRECELYGLGGGASIRHAVTVIKAALPGVEVGTMPSSIYEVFDAMNTISEVAGLKELGEKIRAVTETKTEPTGSESTQM